MERFVNTVTRIGLVAMVVITIGAAGAAWAGGRLSGEGEAQLKNSRRGTVTIGGEVYHVNRRTVMTDAEGGTIDLRTLPVAEEDGSRYELQIAWVAYEAAEVRGRLVLQRLEVQGLPH